MPAVLLNAKMVDGIKPPTDKKVIEYFDDKVRGLCLRVYSSGTKTWTLRIKHGGDKKRLTLGDAGILPLADARTKARELLLAHIKGEDIINPPAPTLSFRELAMEYIDKHSKPNKRSWKEDARKYNVDLDPIFGNVLVDQITRRDIIKYLDGLVKNGFTIKVNRNHGLIREILNFGVDREYLTASPAAGIKKRVKEISRDRVLSDEEIKKVWLAIGKMKSPSKEFFQMYFMTGQRASEVKQFLKAQINLERLTIGVPKEVSKNKRHHVIPITQEMLPLINHAHSNFRESKWLFPSTVVFRRDKTTGDFHISNIQKAIQRLRKTSGVDFNGHDFRRTMATWLAASGVERMTISKLLNHSDKSITAVYDRYSYDNEKRLALEKWTSFLAQIKNT
ncbi:tyrosine-type recombinase/integrase [Bdellovibrio bacteriovorus]|uniref:Bacteriophage P4 integrase n=1 Tax=Bdellovibrio bacteriovorus str. Tiberius TaxID=1069642 RepID=K7YM84_BDEBC|nr:site-specific integrase [Bdellovibrio bacteriovorus]AFY00896.1 Bacteriophage P4 integrase [Bdellovibrio bacteriovorus str. Tiberius]